MAATVPPLTLCELRDTASFGVESFSPFCVKAHRALRAAGLPYTRRHGMSPGSFKKLNPTGQVPVLLVGEEPVSDSTRILERIEALGGVSLNPDPSPAVRAEAWLWEEFADTSICGFLFAARWADDRNWPLVRDAYFAVVPSLVRVVIAGAMRRRVVGSLVARDVWRAGPEECWRRFGALLDQLEARAPKGSGYWVGSAISVADISLFAQLHSLRLSLTAWQSSEIAARASLSAYLDRIDAETREGGQPKGA